MSDDLWETRARFAQAEVERLLAEKEANRVDFGRLWEENEKWKAHQERTKTLKKQAEDELGEARAEAARLRPIVEALANFALLDDNDPLKQAARTALSPEEES